MLYKRAGCRNATVRLPYSFVSLHFSLFWLPRVPVFIDSNLMFPAVSSTKCRRVPLGAPPRQHEERNIMYMMYVMKDDPLTRGGSFGRLRSLSSQRRHAVARTSDCVRSTWPASAARRSPSPHLPDVTATRALGPDAQRCSTALRWPRHSVALVGHCTGWSAHPNRRAISSTRASKPADTIGASGRVKGLRKAPMTAAWSLRKSCVRGRQCQRVGNQRRARSRGHSKHAEQCEPLDDRGRRHFASTCRHNGAPRDRRQRKHKERKPPKSRRNIPPSLSSLCSRGDPSTATQ